MQDIINFLSDVPRLLIIFGLLFILLGFINKIGGFLEVSPIYKKFTLPIGLVSLFLGFMMQSNANIIPNSQSKSTTAIVKSNNFTNGVYNENYTKAKKGTLFIDSQWRTQWTKYASIYEGFTKLPTNKGYKVLNSPNPNDIYEIRNENNPEVSGYIKTNNGVFYFTKYSFKNSKSAKFVEILR